MSQAADSNLPQIDPEEILQGVRRWVMVESPSHDAGAVNTMVDMVEGDMSAIGAEIERIDGREGWGDILIARSPWGGDGPGILVLSHLDTVHPLGVLANENPWRQEGDKVYGPGIYDMKAGAHLAYYAYRHLVRQGRTTPLPITFMFIPEEEVGSPTSQAIIEREALKNKFVLVTEPARDGGKIVTARKGSARFDIRTTGRPAHSGSRHQDGRSAIREMARVILKIEAMTSYETGVTTNVGTIVGGTGANVVPRDCSIEVDMRFPSAELADSAIEAIRALKSEDPDVVLEIEGGLNRPPFDKNEGISALFEHARKVAADVGFDLQDMKTGGGSDGNFTAALGIPTLDGLGADGAGAHTLDEYIHYSSLEPRARMWVGLLETLE